MKLRTALPWPKMTKELLKALRQTRSQASIDKKLGLPFDQTYRWESGTKRLLWREFVAFCVACDAPIKEACERVLFYGGAPKRGDLLLKHLLPETVTAEFTKSYGISRQVYRRWRAGESEPTAVGVLQAIDHMAWTVLPFLSKLVDVDAVPSLRGIHALEVQRREFFYEHPAMTMVLCALGCDVDKSVEKSPAIIARMCGLEVGYVKALLARAVVLGPIRKVRGRYEVESFAFSMRDNPRRSRQHARYIIERAVDALDATEEGPTENFQSTVFTSNAEIDAKATEAVAGLKAALRAAAHKTKLPLDRVTVLTTSVFTPKNVPTRPIEC